ncbi:hypothetical protein F4680DRAFT_426612 [Xylaria scruposa]|nr:hypothetical protein F4680DRAFT_426612 [Xylaria scruposa]
MPTRYSLPSMAQRTQLPGALVLACSLCLLLISILCVAFKSASVSAYNEQTHDGSSNTMIYEPGIGVIGLYPVELIMPIPSLLTATASINLVISLVIASVSAWLIRRKRPLGMLRTERITLFTILSTNALLSTVTFIYQSVLAGRSTRFDPNYNSETGLYDKGAFTLEGWTCEVPMYFPNFDKHDFGIQCTGERASRVLSVLVWILANAVLGLLVWDMKSGQMIMSPKKTVLQEEDPWN